MEPESFVRDILRRTWHDRGLWAGLAACAGAVVIGVTLPTVLVCWNWGREGSPDLLPGMGAATEKQLPSWDALVSDWIGLQIAATMFCGPGAVVLGAILYRLCKRIAQKLSDESGREVITFGMWVGALMAFGNVPGYFVGALLPMSDGPLVLLKVFLLFAIAGMSSGAWIAWQAVRAAHPEKRFWPQYSLATLLIVVIAWGALMGIFAPVAK